MQILRDVGTAVEKLGGNVSIARRLGICKGAVGNWKLRGFFPNKRYIFLNREAAKLGYAIDESLFPEMFDD